MVAHKKWSLWESLGREFTVVGGGGGGEVTKLRKNANHHFCFGWILSQQESRNNSNVPARITCIPHSITEERHLISDFYVKPIETIQSCQEVTSGCQRFPRMYTYYPHTTFNRTIDVGVCAGSCGNQLSCRPVWTNQKAIATPNGEWPWSVNWPR